MRKVLLKLGLAVVWFLGLPLAVPFVHSFVHDRWIIQEGAPQYRWGVLVAVLWCAVLWLIWPDAGQLRSAKLLPLPAFFGAILVWFGGYIVLVTINCMGDTSPAQVVDVRLVERFKQGVRFAVASGEHTGLEFECSASRWGPVGVGERHLVLRRGRRGIYWGQLEHSD